MVDIITPTRAKVAYFEESRPDKYGKRKPSKVRQDIIVSNGVFSSKEIEKEAVRLAGEHGYDENSIRIEAYQAGEAPVEANPPKVHEPRRSEVKVRRVFGGWSPPKTEEEMAEYLAEFEARRASLMEKTCRV